MISSCSLAHMSIIARYVDFPFVDFFTFSRDYLRILYILHVSTYVQILYSSRSISFTRFLVCILNSAPYGLLHA